jgi:hypothetical protein
MPVRWQPLRERTAKVKSFTAAKGRIGMVFIGNGSLFNEMPFRRYLDSEI